jgi:hypothetical protein
MHMLTHEPLSCNKLDIDNNDNMMFIEQEQCNKTIRLPTSDIYKYPVDEKYHRCPDTAEDVRMPKVHEYIENLCEENGLEQQIDEQAYRDNDLPCREISQL